jgi:hypothetical protein
MLADEFGVIRMPGRLSDYDEFARERVDLTRWRPSMADRDPQDSEILAVIADGGETGIDPERLVSELRARKYAPANVIEALQRAIERGKISLSSAGMVVSLNPEYAHAA